MTAPKPWIPAERWQGMVAGFCISASIPDNVPYWLLMILCGIALLILVDWRNV